jgi:hypothetical protein
MTNLPRKGRSRKRITKEGVRRGGRGQEVLDRMRCWIPRRPGRRESDPSPTFRTCRHIPFRRPKQCCLGCLLNLFAQGSDMSWMRRIWRGWPALPSLRSEEGFLCSCVRLISQLLTRFFPSRVFLVFLLLYIASTPISSQFHMVACLSFATRE